ncbi:MAG: hypothetical protein C0625_13845 [Arcobacter sp.]|nr:MAG: hypothetical protein C0625_13845 [Arcobacter sp.]
MRLIRLMTCIFIFVSLLHAEVMDKEPSLVQNFVWGIGGSILVILSARYKPRLLIVSLPVTIFYFYLLFGEINDPYVGPAILKEAGTFYINSVYYLCALLFISPFIGIYWRVRTQKT